MTDLHSTIDEAFAPAIELLEWGKSDIDEVMELLKKLFSPGFARFVQETDPLTGQTVAKVRFVRPLPPQLKRKSNEALLHTKHSFDRVMYAARNLLIKKKNSGVNYPWAETPSDLERRLRNAEIPSALHDVLREHQPYWPGEGYNGGRSADRTLAALANSKHKASLQCNATGGIDELAGSIRFAGYADVSIVKPNWNPEKLESEIMRWTGTPVELPSGRFNFIIRFDDNRLPGNQDVWITLLEFHQFATHVHATIKSRCSDVLLAG